MDDPVPGESIRIGVDIGGTFTDLVLDCGGRIHVTKVPSVTGDPGKGVLTALHRAADALAIGLDTLLARTTLFVHGSTIATNTVLEHKGATVGLITTGGFRDSLEIRRGLRSDPWEHRTPYPPVLVPRYLRLPVPGRLDANAVEIAPVEIGALDGIVRAFDAASVESIAVCLLNSYLDPAHEIAYGEKLRALRPGGWLSLSHEIVPVMGEYERTATTVLNAYIAPRTVGYLGTLDRSLRAAGLARSMLLVQNNGGSIGADQIGNRPVTLLLSGPAAGVGALDLARDALGTDRLIGMEIGGTSCDAMLMEDGAVPTSDALSVGGYDAAVPSIDIHTIGAGGGTIAHVDAAGRLEVGPHGAGAYPGPAAYGLGGDAPTITDALLVLSRLRGGPYPGASVSLDAELAREAIARRIAEPLSLSVEDAAAGIARLLEQNLLQAVEQMTLERGLDPRTFALVAAGGAGPMHGASIGRRLGCRQVHVPRHSGAYCALGMLNTDVRHDLIRAYYAPLDSTDPAAVRGAYAALEAHGREALAADGFEPNATRLDRFMDLRHIGQQWSIPVLADDGEPRRIRDRFEAVHERRYRHTQPDGIVEITALRVVATGIIPGVTLCDERGPAAPPAPADSRCVYIDEHRGWADTRVYAGETLRPGHVIEGPAIVEEQTTTVYIGCDDRLAVDGYGNFRIELESARHRQSCTRTERTRNP